MVKNQTVSPKSVNSPVENEVVTKKGENDSTEVEWLSNAVVNTEYSACWCRGEVRRVVDNGLQFACCVI